MDKWLEDYIHIELTKPKWTFIKEIKYLQFKIKKMIGEHNDYVTKLRELL